MNSASAAPHCGANPGKAPCNPKPGHQADDRKCWWSLTDSRTDTFRHCPFLYTIRIRNVQVILSTAFLSADSLDDFKHSVECWMSPSLQLLLPAFAPYPHLPLPWTFYLLQHEGEEVVDNTKQTWVSGVTSRTPPWRRTGTELTPGLIQAR